MLVKLGKEVHKIIRTTTNGGDKAKFHIYYMEGNNDQDAVKIVKLTLAKEPKQGFKLIRIFKKQYVHHEMIVLKSSTLFGLSELIKNIQSK